MACNYIRKYVCVYEKMRTVYMGVCIYVYMEEVYACLNVFSTIGTNVSVVRNV